jgi:transforming growth factor-beta-induced protein
MDPSTLMGVLQYHVLNGVFPASAFTTTQQFIPTMLTGSSSNLSNSTMKLMNATMPLTAVTGGQVVGAMVVGSKVMIMSGLKAMSTVQTAVGTSHLHLLDDLIGVDM